MRQSLQFGLAPILLLCLVPAASARNAQRLHIAPRFVKGETLRYGISTSTSSNERDVTPVINPEGASEYKESMSLVLRLDVLDVAPAAPSSQELVRFRVTFEEANSDSQANAYAPRADAFNDAMDSLKGHSFEFSLQPGGKLADVQSLDRIAPQRDVAARVLSWLHVLFAPVEIPAQGITLGQKWTNERQLTDLPLKDLVWRNESAYLRNEPCAASSGVQGVQFPGKGAGCAVLLTRFRILRHGSDHSDATPETYIRNGLRTSGRWTGSGESLAAISLESGLLVSSTQTATQDMDYEIRSAISGSAIHHTGQMTTQTEITLLPAAAR